MASGTPSMLALLGVLAVAGYQNRDKLAEMLGSAGGRRPGGSPPAGPTPAGPAGEAGRDSGAMAAGGIGAMLSDGLRDIVDRFRQSGQGDAAESWVGAGPNRPVAPRELETAIGTEALDDLAERTGLSRQEMIARLTRDLPGAVDGCTPDGCLAAR
jgi:uncharacterized protein YidB (DUF937 family)